MCVHDDPFRPAVGDAENDVGRLAADAVELDQFVERVRDFSTVFFDKTLAAVADGPCLVAEEAGAANHGLEFGGRRAGEIDRAAVALKQRRGDEIDAFVRALCAENGGDEQLERVVVVQGTARVGIRGAQAAKDRAATR